MLERLSGVTYELRHNPNCPSPFLIVTCGDGGAIGRPGNLHSYGKTLDEAVSAALTAIDELQRSKKAEWDHRKSLWRIRMAEWPVRGVIWA